jgi:hypothetical protein
MGQGSQKSLINKKGGPIIRQAEALDENRIVLYKKGKQLGQGYYIVEISSNNTHLFIAAYDVESPESLLIELPERRAQDILTEFQNDYESMASSLQVMNKRLVLLNPVSIKILFYLFYRNLSTKKDSVPHQISADPKWTYNKNSKWMKMRSHYKMTKKLKTCQKRMKTKKWPNE